MGVEAPVGLRQSDRVDGPMLAGWWRPVILVPAGFLSGLPPAQVEALLLHELAHVRRHDVLVGRLQAVVETLLFFHPATWWISRQVRQAREACCDDLVVQAGSGRRTYAEALAALAEQAVEGSATTAWAPAATDGSLLDRIQRLVVPPEAPSTAGRRLSIVAATLLMVIVPVGLAACASQQSTTEADVSRATADPERTMDAPKGAEAPAAPDAPSMTDAQQKIVVLREDSTERTIRFGTEGPVEVDSLEEDVYVFRYGNRVDTVDLPGLDGPKRFSHPPFSPDSLERALRAQFDPDSLARVMEARINPDSLERAILRHVNPDSIERAVRMRFDRDSLEQHIHRMERRADSIAQRFAKRFSDDFDPEEFAPNLNVDSLRRWHEEHADSLRRHFEQLRERWERSDRVHMKREVPEQLREEARRLREQAERLEERAEEMEKEQPSSPDEPQDPQSESG